MLEETLKPSSFKHYFDSKRETMCKQMQIL